MTPCPHILILISLLQRLLPLGHMIRTINCVHTLKGEKQPMLLLLLHAVAQPVIIVWDPMAKNNTDSFTLIEILIVSTIVLLLSGVSLAIFSTYRNDKALENQATVLANVLELAKNKADAGDVSLCSNSDTAHVNGYSVSIDPTSINLSPGCDTIPTPIVYAIPANIVYVTPTFSVQFDDKNYQGTTRKFPIKNNDTNKCKFVQIDETGLITNGNCTCPCP
jgi:Tfp pilus assembly protein FimT